MSASSTRWTLVVSSQTDRAVRAFLAAAGAGAMGDISLFVEDAVKAFLADAARKAAIKRRTGMDADHFDRALSQVRQWAKLRRGR